MKGVRVANAPVSFGAFEATGGPDVPAAEDVLAAIAAGGYEGTELGPPGYLGNAETLPATLARHDLVLTGGYVPIAFTEPHDLDELDLVLDLFEAAGAPTARPVLADAGPRSGKTDWQRFAEGVRRAAEHARARGFAPTFHHHAGTRVESPAEIERLLERTDVPLLLDSGHLALAGGDPVAALRDWRERIDYVHLKDVRAEATEWALADVWRRGGFCELGAGIVALDAFLLELERPGYAGWVVVEQDALPGDLAGARESQARNRRWLAERGI
ncbi:MAG: sugar phosphate isomerase/epimerase [Gaiellaceae bacterium MAG52_C11]|nr:sugar phosphate isomerase/epimerase [Candidatus Gaiellasilicea maunaloa]